MNRICSDRELKEFFEDQKPHSVEEIKEHFKISKIVVYREMKGINAMPAINKTAFFLLSGSKRPDRNGFVKIDDMVFFSGGNLMQALICVVTKSNSGMTAKELQKLVGTRAKGQLLSLVKRNKLYRHKFAGEYYYFSTDKETRTRQLEVRERLLAKPDHRLRLEQAESLPLELVVKILVTFVRNPDFSAKSIALSLVRRGENVRTHMVKSVFVKYDLCKKNY